MDKIKRNLVFLADNLTNLERVLLYLMENDIISLNESDEISNADTPFKQNYKLLNVIQRKDLSINIFLEILRNTQNGHCANKIEEISPKTDRKLKKPKILKSVWWPDKKLLIESLHKRTIGDKLLIEILHDRILTDKRRMLVICESSDASKLTGMGGVGKTLTATWYGHHYEKEYDQVIWIDCGEESLLKSFKKLALDLKIEERNEIVDLEDFTRKSYEALEEFKCLWIFDNAERYRGEEGIKDILPKYKDNFYCLITSRWREWGVENVGYGQIPRLELNIFGESESLEFFKENLQQDIKYTEYQLRQLSKLLGNLPLAMQLAVAALNTGNIDLKNYIEKTSTKDLKNIVDTQFDDYEKTINECVSITLELIGKEEGGAFAKEILNVFGYIRPDGVEEYFLTRVFDCNSNLTFREMSKAVQLLTKYSIITKVIIDNDLQSDEEESEIEESEAEESESDYDELMTILSVHRLLQQVIRHNGREKEKKTLRKIIGCKGSLDYKLLPFTKYADQQLRNEYPKVKAELLDQQQLVKLVKEKRFEESVQLAKFIHKELQKTTTKFNYAICLEMNGQLEDNTKVLEELYKTGIKEEIDYGDFPAKMGLLQLENEVSKSLVGGHLFVSHWKMDNKEKLEEIMEERKSFKMIHSQGMATTLLRILNSNLIQTNYSLTEKDSTFEIALEGDIKRIELFNYRVDFCIPLPVDLEELILYGVEFKDANAKDKTIIDVSDWLPKKLSNLRCDFMESKKIIVSLEFLSSIENITLEKCSLNLDSKNRICSRQLKLDTVFFIKNGQELSNVKVNKFIDFNKINRLELVGDETNLSIDLSEESADIEYLRLDYVNVVSLKSASDKTRVNIKIAKIENCSVDLSILPSSLEKLSLSLPELSVSGGIDLPNLKYLTLQDDISHLSRFRSLQLSNLYLRWLREVNMDLLPPSIKIIRIDKEGDDLTRLVGGVINLEKLVLYGFPLTEVEEMLHHFQLNQLVLSRNSYKSVDLVQLMDKKVPIIAIGRVDWWKEDFKNSIISKQVDREAGYYLLHEGKGKAIEKKDFDELHLLKDNFGP